MAITNAAMGGDDGGLRRLELLRQLAKHKADASGGNRPKAVDVSAQKQVKAPEISNSGKAAAAISPSPAYLQGGGVQTQSGRPHLGRHVDIMA